MERAEQAAQQRFRKNQMLRLWDDDGVPVHHRHMLARITAMAVPAGWSAGRNHGENLLAIELHRAGVLPCEVRQQHPLGRFKVDFAFLEQQLALEADGWMHVHPDQQERDRRRDLELFDMDWCTVRVDPHRPDLPEWTRRFVALFGLRRGEPSLRGAAADAERSALLLPSREQLRAAQV